SWPITIIDARFTAVSASQNPIVVGGAAQTFTVTLANNGNAISHVLLNSVIRQGTTALLTGGAYVDCGGAAGLLPQGTCTVTQSHSVPSGVPLVAGAASLSLVAIASDGVVDSTAVPVTIAVQPPR
ncbi:MAG: hypothetical protein ACREBE_25485, partial [bacterium]